MAEELNDQERHETELWQVLDWSLWGNGLGDVLRTAMADVMVSALSREQREQAEACIKAWHAGRGPSMAVGEGTELAKRVAYLEARVGELNNTIGELRASIADIDAHATPVGLLHNDDPEGSPHHYMLTVGALHRALGKAYTAEPCESERARLRSELDRLHSWAGLMELLDEHWPAEVFDGQSEDSGPRIVSLIRAVDAERASRQAWAEEAMRLELADEARHCTGACDCPANVHIDGCFYSDTAVPQCAVHPEAGGE